MTDSWFRSNRRLAGLKTKDLHERHRRDTGESISIGQFRLRLRHARNAGEWPPKPPTGDVYGQESVIDGVRLDSVHPLPKAERARLIRDFSSNRESTSPEGGAQPEGS